MDGLEEMQHSSIDITMNGIRMEIQPLNATQAAIVRITSGNPQDYLNPQISPGRIIEFQPFPSSKV
jgi:hypothetical protein